MSLSDNISVIALAVSLVALIIASIQMTQQLLSTAYDGYRRCSERTIGGWARRTHRRFVWRELRFEVTFWTPLIELVLDSPQPWTGRISTDQCRYLLLTGGHRARQFNATESPWFLRSEKTVTEAKCTWLALLQDTAWVKVQVNITQRIGSWDYVPTTMIRPMASIDRKSFLTLMSLFGINWKNKGRDGQFTGAGRFCEVRATKIVEVGEVFRYEESRHKGEDDHSNQRFFLESEKARLAMFHCFDLGFATFRTHDNSELLDSLKHRDGVQNEEAINTVSAFYRGSQEWCPGLSESITCWAEGSMPKWVNLRTDTFTSQFSAVSARSLTTGTPKFVAMLLGGECNEYCFRSGKAGSVDTLTGWAKQYLASFPDVKRKVFEGLKLAASEKTNNNIVDLKVSWTESRRCLEGVRALDEHLETQLLGNFTDDEQRKKFKSYFSNRQIIRGSTLFRDASNEAGRQNTFWLDELDSVGASNYVSIANDIEEKVENPVLAQRIVVNRLMRGSLWVVHNSSAPDQYKRVLECSLSSSWLQEDNPTLTIA